MLQWHTKHQADRPTLPCLLRTRYAFRKASLQASLQSVRETFTFLNACQFSSLFCFFRSCVCVKPRNKGHQSNVCSPWTRYLGTSSFALFVPVSHTRFLFVFLCVLSGLRSWRRFCHQRHSRLARISSQTTSTRGSERDGATFPKESILY